MTEATTTTTTATATATTSSFLISKVLLLKDLDPEKAKPQFFFLFFAGSGAGGIGLSRVPKILEEINNIKALANTSKSGGDILQTGPIINLLYPPMYVQDVQQVIAKIPTDSSKINQQGTSESYFARQLGYIVQEDFMQYFKNCNPLAVNAAFEALAGGSGKCIAPQDVNDKVQTWKSSPPNHLSAFTSDLQKATLAKLSAYATLLFLLFVTFDLIVETGINAFL